MQRSGVEGVPPGAVYKLKRAIVKRLPQLQHKLAEVHESANAAAASALALARRANATARADQQPVQPVQPVSNRILQSI